VGMTTGSGDRLADCLVRPWRRGRVATTNWVQWLQIPVAFDRMSVEVAASVAPSCHDRFRCRVVFAGSRAFSTAAISAVDREVRQSVSSACHDARP